MGWNWCVHLAKHCEVYVITEDEFCNPIEAAVPLLEQGRNLHFHYLPVTERVRRMCWNQGDWRFYYYYKRWQRRAADVAREICQRERVDVLHQLNMLGFREPGYLWQVSKETGIPFIWGPIGGLMRFPISYAAGEPMKLRAFLRLKNFLNSWQLKHNTRVEQAFRQASLLFSTTPDSYRAILRCKGLDSIIIPDTGTFPRPANWFSGQRFLNSQMAILWAGKFDFRKQLGLALRIIAQAVEDGVNVRLQVFGSGNDQQRHEARELSDCLGIADRVEWRGNCPNREVNEAMQQADLFLFTSVSEENSTVVMEAISSHLPILCFDACGMSAVVTDDIGRKIALTNPEQSVKDFAGKIVYLYHHREELVSMSENCRERAEQLSWDNKARQVVELYGKI